MTRTHVKEQTEELTDLPSLVRYAMEHFPAEWLFAAFAVFVLGWVVRGTAEPVMKYWKEDREARRRHELELARLRDARERRLSGRQQKSA